MRAGKTIKLVGNNRFLLSLREETGIMEQGDGTMFDAILRADQVILNGIQDLLRCDFLDILMTFVTKLGNAGFIWILLGLLLCCFRRWRRTGVILLCSVAAAFLIGEVTI